jgi:hypothetical protein
MYFWDVLSDEALGFTDEQKKVLEEARSQEQKEDRDERRNDRISTRVEALEKSVAMLLEKVLDIKTPGEDEAKDKIKAVSA